MKKGYLQKIFIKNLMYILEYKHINVLKEASAFLSVNYSTFRSWVAFERMPTLITLDKICDILKIPTYILFIPDLTPKKILDATDIKIKNNTVKILQKNFTFLYRDKSWNNIVSDYSGLLSEETLKSYQRSNKNIVPPISTLETMCSYLGIPAYKLLKDESQCKIN